MLYLYVIILILFLYLPSPAQIYTDDTLFIGNPDGSPVHVPYQGAVDIPIWINPYGLGGGFINLTTFNYAVSERLGGNFYYPWPYLFSDPIYYQNYSAQILSFDAVDPPDSLVHLADFTFIMDIDSSYIGDTLQFMTADGIFYDPYGYIVFIFRINISQVVIDAIVSVEQEYENPEEISILQNYPNPFNATTTIKFLLLKREQVKIEILDLLGRRVEILLNWVMQPGSHRIIWDATGYASGIYYYRVQAGEYMRTMRMVYLK